LPLLQVALLLLLLLLLAELVQELQTHAPLSLASLRSFARSTHPESYACLPACLPSFLFQPAAADGGRFACCCCCWGGGGCGWGCGGF
jgi:hypothetical protein